VITPDSRYTTAVITTSVDLNGETRQEMRVPFPRSKLITYTYHRVIEGERIDTIAYDYYQNGTLWWKIADANPEVFDWFDVPAGTTLRIPNA
jgi:phage tail protein X